MRALKPALCDIKADDVNVGLSSIDEARFGAAEHRREWLGNTAYWHCRHQALCGDNVACMPRGAISTVVIMRLDEKIWRVAESGDERKRGSLEIGVKLAASKHGRHREGISSFREGHIMKSI